MPYETDPAGLGVGKSYGAEALAGGGGIVSSTDGEYQFVVEVSAEDLERAEILTHTIPEGYGLITGVYVEVEEAFGVGDTVDVLYDATTVLSAPVSVAAATVVSGALAVSPTVIDDTAAITIDASLVDSGSTTGYAKIVVELKRV